MDRVQRKLMEMAETMTWREIGDALGVSGSAAWNRANGRTNSCLQIDKALGFHRDRYRVALEFDSEEERDRAIKAFERLGKTRKLQSQWLVILALGHLLDRFDREQGIGIMEDRQ